MILYNPVILFIFECGLVSGMVHETAGKAFLWSLFVFGISIPVWRIGKAANETDNQDVDIDFNILVNRVRFFSEFFRNGFSKRIRG